ncbi:uncharacterized protein Z519_00775 [Cladophialophora bantiana CBS 173.52]|uniref:Myb-like DNA-binding domain-containing protein n=1 Tax=Cladophialophora bantiana (strain ATCC 10958 / CBS 173.52 / CDC B-1940 / NIH 8579) TaxID=1442370 RepID=A0A0D2GL64_CLAB1|nr:uncharacterized protein Z519_00775 [Cladophialophora bantiana CBS 173.52]KIW99112.1 hypothetical protein Z519_00775 [Cladophialophora bantiana CBS 173.52]
MVSIRRTKNFANDPQTPVFLYTILKQLDLRSVNWNQVADSLGISNGHAARMRYSRMRSQFEDVVNNQPKPVKPRKENTNTGENKSCKSKPRNKRLLEPEENEQLASQRAACQHVMQPDHDPKRIKFEPQSYMQPWYPTYPADPAQMYPGSFWGQPTISLKPVPGAAFANSGLPEQKVAPTPAIKTEPHTTSTACNNVETPTLTIKQEPQEPVCECEGADVGATIVKEPGTTVEDQALANAVGRDSVSPSYPLSRIINTFFGPRQTPSGPAQAPSLPANMALYATTQASSRGSYLPLGGHNQSQNALPWSALGPGQNSLTLSTDDTSDMMILNPYATSYQDMLNMPLYRLHPETCALQTPNAKNQHITIQPGVTEERTVEQKQQNHSVRLPSFTWTATTPSPLPASLTTKNSNGGDSTRTSITPSGSSIASSELGQQKGTSGQLPAISTIIEVDSEGAGEAEACSTNAVDGVTGPKIKKEPVGL